jgi:serine phosphatase RsbU (regulator of sigma subunit)
LRAFCLRIGITFTLSLVRGRNSADPWSADGKMVSMGGSRRIPRRGEAEPGGAGVTRRRPQAAAIALLVLLLATGLMTWLTAHVVHDQERKLLSERATEINLVLEENVNSIATQLGSLGHLSGEHPSLFDTEAAADLGNARTQAIALLHPGPGPGTWTVVTSAGTGLRPGQVLDGVAARTATEALSMKGMLATRVYGLGAARSIGFVMAAPSGAVVYRQDLLGPPRPPSAAGTAPFSEVRVVLYDSTTRDPAQVLTTTAPKLPLGPSAIYTPYMAGRSRWLLGVEAAQPLVGSVASDAPWAVLIVGVVGAALVYGFMESVVRRRNAALLLYQSEHRFAETLQRRLLSPLVAPPGLDVASRYVAASDDHQVGGDWFDVFDLDGGRVGMVIGDVMGHDVEAAAAMAQVRAGLRAYAIEGGSPGTVLARLAHLIEAFEITVLVTVVYGIIDAPEGDGSRVFRWANAGHLPPLVHRPSGEVSELTGGVSPVLGAPVAGPRSEGSCEVTPGSTIVLYTDGLVEEHGVDLGESLAALRAALHGRAGLGSAEDICESVLAARLPERRHDDIALVAVQVESAPRANLPEEKEVLTA